MKPVPVKSLKITVSRTPQSLAIGLQNTPLAFAEVLSRSLLRHFGDGPEKYTVTSVDDFREGKRRRRVEVNSSTIGNDHTAYGAADVVLLCVTRAVQATCVPGAFTVNHSLVLCEDEPTPLAWTRKRNPPAEELFEQLLGDLVVTEDEPYADNDVVVSLAEDFERDRELRREVRQSAKWSQWAHKVLELEGVEASPRQLERNARRGAAASASIVLGEERRMTDTTDQLTLARREAADLRFALHLAELARLKAEGQFREAERKNRDLNRELERERRYSAALRGKLFSKTKP